MLVQAVVDGLAAGGVYGLVGLALVLTHRTSGVPNFALGEMGTLGAFVAVGWMGGSTAGVVGTSLALATAFVVGATVERWILSRARGATHLLRIMPTIGVMLALFGLVGWRWGGAQRAFPGPLAGSPALDVAGVSIAAHSVVTIGVGVVTVVAFFLFFRWTRLGLAIRVLQQDREVARSLGVPADRASATAHGIAAALCALAAVLIAPTVTLDPTLMWEPLLKGFAAAVVGGLTSPLGAVLGGYLLGVSENVLGVYVSLDLKTVLALGVIVVTLWVRPSGLLGRPPARRV